MTNCELCGKYVLRRKKMLTSNEFPEELMNLHKFALACTECHNQCVDRYKRESSPIKKRQVAEECKKTKRNALQADDEFVRLKQRMVELYPEPPKTARRYINKKKRKK